jgi:anti-anti-sigma factor
MLGEVHVRPDSMVVTLHGDLDLMTVEALRDLLEDVARSTASPVVVELADVAFVDVMSLSVIMSTADALRDEGRQLVVRGASSAVRRICALLNADDILAPALPEPRPALARHN